MKFQESKGFDAFWKRARAYWTLGTALAIYHASADPWLILSQREKA